MDSNQHSFPSFEYFLLGIYCIENIEKRRKFGPKGVREKETITR